MRLYFDTRDETKRSDEWMVEVDFDVQITEKRESNLFCNHDTLSALTLAYIDLNTGKDKACI